MSKLEYHRITPQIALYQQKNSPFWWVYLSFKNGGNERLSTKKRDLAEATEVAIILYSQIKEEKENGTITTLKKYTSKPTFKQVCEEVMDWYQSHDFGTYTTYRAYSGLIKNHLLTNQHFKDKYISTFTLSDIETILNNHPKRGRTTLVNVKTVLKKIFDHSEQKKYIKRDEYPKFPEQHTQVNYYINSPIDDADLGILLSENDEFINNKFLTPSSRKKRLLLFKYMRCLYFTGARAGDELLAISWGDFSIDFFVKVEEAENQEYLGGDVEEEEEGYWGDDVYLKITAGKMRKKKQREIILNKSAKKEFEKLAEFQGVDLMNLSSDELKQKCFKWGNNEGKHKGYNVVFSRFQEFLKENDHNYYQLSKEYNLTAFRHTYITKAIVQGMRLEDIALNCGNTPQTIMKVYHHVISRMRRDHITKIELDNF